MLDEKDEETLASMQDLTIVLNNQQKYKEAEEHASLRRSSHMEACSYGHAIPEIPDRVRPQLQRTSEDRRLLIPDAARLIATFSSSSSYELDLGQPEYVCEIPPHHFEHIFSMAVDRTTLTRAPSLPQDIVACQNFFSTIKIYIQNEFETQNFGYNDTGEPISRSASLASSKNLKSFHVYCVTAVDLLDQGCLKEGFIWFRQAALLAEELIKDKDPRLLEVFADISMLLLERNKSDLYYSLRNQICRFVELKAREQGEQNRPFALIFSQLNKLSGPWVLKTIEECWKCWDDRFIESPLGTNKICYSNYLSRMHTKLNAEKNLDTCLTKRLVRLGAPGGSLHLQYAHGKMSYLEGKYFDALEWMDKVILECQIANREYGQKWWQLEIDALEISARSHREISMQNPVRGRDIDAEAALERAVQMSKEMHGPNSAITLGLETTAWIWHQERDQNEEAKALKERLDKTISAGLDIVAVANSRFRCLQ